jgi:hypothetical protein
MPVGHGSRPELPRLIGRAWLRIAAHELLLPRLTLKAERKEGCGRGGLFWAKVGTARDLLGRSS